MLGTEGNLFSLMKFTYQNPKARMIFHGGERAQSGFRAALGCRWCRETRSPGGWRKDRKGNSVSGLRLVPERQRGPLHGEHPRAGEGRRVFPGVASWRMCLARLSGPGVRGRGVRGSAPGLEPARPSVCSVRMCVCVCALHAHLHVCTHPCVCVCV